VRQSLLKQFDYVADGYNSADDDIDEVMHDAPEATTRHGGELKRRRGTETQYAEDDPDAVSDAAEKRRLARQRKKLQEQQEQQESERRGQEYVAMQRRLQELEAKIRHNEAQEQQSHAPIEEDASMLPPPGPYASLAAPGMLPSSSTGASAIAFPPAAAAPSIAAAALGSDLWVFSATPFPDDTQGGLSSTGVGYLVRNPSRDFDPTARVDLAAPNVKEGPVHQCVFKQTYIAHAFADLHTEVHIMRRILMSPAPSPHIPRIYGMVNMAVPLNKDSSMVVEEEVSAAADPRAKKRSRIKRKNYVPVQCVAMEWVRGVSLFTLLMQVDAKSKVLSPFIDHGGMTERLRLAIQLVRAMRWLHERGIYHRDLKPGNIMVSSPTLFEHLLRNDGFKPMEHFLAPAVSAGDAARSARAVRVACLEAGSATLNANATLQVDGFAPDPPRIFVPKDVGSNTRLVVIDFNTAMLQSDVYASSEHPDDCEVGTEMFTEKHWFQQAPLPSAANVLLPPSAPVVRASGRADTVSEHWWPAHDQFSLGMCIMDILRFHSIDDSEHQLKKMLTHFTQYTQMVYNTWPEPNGQKGKSVPSLSEFLRTQQLSVKVFGKSFILANQRVKEWYGRYPAVRALLHTLTRKRMSVEDEDSGLWCVEPVPTMAVIEQTLLNILEENSPEALKEKSQALKVKAHDVGGDGDCTFLAFKDQVNQHPNHFDAPLRQLCAADVTPLRVRLAEWITADQDRWTAIQRFMINEGMTADESVRLKYTAVQKLRNKGEWQDDSGDFVMPALCTMFKCRAKLIDPLSSIDSTVLPIGSEGGSEGGSAKEQPTLPELCFFKRCNHWQSSRPL
jgi:serine/threonine protein kinase